MGENKILYRPDWPLPWHVYYKGGDVGACLTFWGARYRLRQVKRRYRKAARINAREAQRG